MIKLTLQLSTAVALAMLATSPGTAAKLRLPPAQTPKDEIYSPGAVAMELEKRGYRIESMKRQGTAYSIKATGRSGNKVQLMVDGRSSEIVGLAVLSAAANMVAAIAGVMKTGKNARYVDDWHPFGIIVPEIYQVRWTPIVTWTAGPVYVDAVWTGRGYRYAVPYRSIRPGRGGLSRTTIAPARLQQPLYGVYDSSGVEMETVSISEDTTIISEVTTEETTYSAEFEAMEESYLGGELAEESFEEVSDYDAEDGDLAFADDANDGYDSDLYEADDDSGLDETDVADDGGEADVAGETEEVDDADDADEADESDDVEDEPDEAEEVEEAEEEADEPDEAYDDSGDDYGDDDGGDDYDDGGDEPDLSLGR
ncbi:MAG: PepSY domain-containing protein [Alphaproteobacteria bacterium]